MAPMGAYCRIIAWMLIFRAALRYFSDSERSEVDRCDIPARDMCMNGRGRAGGFGGELTVKRVSSPQQLLHVLRHDARHILQLVVELVKV